jgi:hypothetical protein
MPFRGSWSLVHSQIASLSRCPWHRCALRWGVSPHWGRAGGLTDGKSTSSRGMWPDSHKRLGKYPRGHRIAQCDAGAGFPGSST